MSSSNKVRFINPPNRLKMKTGGGGIPEERIARAQIVMDDFKTDFRPIAAMLATDLNKATKTALEKIARNENFEKDKIINPIMQLKANGGMFKYGLLTDIADICLQFMEAVNDYNKEAIDIIKAHEKAIQVIIQNNLEGDGGKEGYVLVQELHLACSRYFKKYKA